MVGFLKTLLAFLVSFSCTISSFAFDDFAGGGVVTEDNKKCNINIAAISDVHMLENAPRQMLLELGLEDMQNSDKRYDALVLAGDNTNNASLVQYKYLHGAFAQFDPADQIIMAAGNHDTWNKEIDPDDRFPRSEELFIEYTKKICNRDVDKFYFTTEVKGYTFIVLGSEDDTTYGTISEEQLQWLEEELWKASAKELPVFVVSHYVFEDAHGLPETWSDDLEEALDGSYSEGVNDKLFEILNKHDNIFLISGHLHNGLANGLAGDYTFSTVEKIGNITSINLPTYSNTNVRGTPSCGVGAVIEVYDDEVVIKGRCFSANVWYTNYVFPIDLV